MRHFNHKKLDIVLSDAKINAAAVAREAGVSASALYQIRKGLFSPGANVLVALSDVLKIPMEYFFEED